MVDFSYFKGIRDMLVGVVGLENVVFFVAAFCLELDGFVEKQHPNLLPCILVIFLSISLCNTGLLLCLYFYLQHVFTGIVFAMKLNLCLA